MPEDGEFSKDRKNKYDKEKPNTEEDNEIDEEKKYVGNPPGSRLWWFVDGHLEGESEGSQVKTVPMTVGKHVISCTTAEGVSASVRITVSE